MEQDSGFGSFITQESSSSLNTTERDFSSELFGACSSPDSSSTEKSSSELVISETPEVVGCRKRKQYVPQKASYLNDPNFKGVTIKMDNRFVNGEWKLVINHTFSLPKRKKRIFKPYTDSSEEEEVTNNYTFSSSEGKHCASCSAKKTPLWRDAEDGTPLCNACGIRYKKYKMRCETCWHIPKKDEFEPPCRACGSSYVSPRR